MVYTSYFGKLNKLPPDIVPVSICGKAPAWYNGLQYKKLAPKYSFFSEWRKNGDNSFYIKHFHDEVLSTLSPQTVYNELLMLSGGKDIALICYEKPTSFCHRHLIAEWFITSGIKCEEIAF